MSLLRRFELDATREQARRQVAEVRTAQGAQAADDSPMLFGLPTTLTPRLEGRPKTRGVLVDLAALERELLAA